MAYKRSLRSSPPPPPKILSQRGFTESGSQQPAAWRRARPHQPLPVVGPSDRAVCRPSAVFGSAGSWGQRPLPSDRCTASASGRPGLAEHCNGGAGDGRGLREWQNFQLATWNAITSREKLQEGTARDVPSLQLVARKVTKSVFYFSQRYETSRKVWHDYSNLSRNVDLNVTRRVTGDVAPCDIQPRTWRTLAHRHALTHAVSLWRTLARMHALNLWRTLARTHALAHALNLWRTLARTHSLTHPRMNWRTLVHTHALAHAHIIRSSHNGGEEETYP